MEVGQSLRCVQHRCGLSERATAEVNRRGIKSSLLYEARAMLSAPEWQTSDRDQREANVRVSV